MENTAVHTPTPGTEAMLSAGVHYGYAKSRRHPSVKGYLFGVKDTIDIIDVDKSKTLLDAAKSFVSELGRSGKTVLFISTKHEALAALTKSAEAVEMPYVIGRWIGGTLTNFPIIRKRVEKLLTLRKQRAEGELSKYTKREQLMIDREIERLEKLFSGIVSMDHVPAALFVIDPGKEHTAVKEAQALKIPVIALAGSDCDVSGLTYPIVGNDSSIASISFFVEQIADAYREGKAAPKV